MKYIEPYLIGLDEIVGTNVIDVAAYDAGASYTAPTAERALVSYALGADGDLYGYVGSTGTSHAAPKPGESTADWTYLGPRNSLRAFDVQQGVDQQRIVGTRTVNGDSIRYALHGLGRVMAIAFWAVDALTIRVRATDISAVSGTPFYKAGETYATAPATKVLGDDLVRYSYIGTPGAAHDSPTAAGQTDWEVLPADNTYSLDVGGVLDHVEVLEDLANVGSSYYRLCYFPIVPNDQFILADLNVPPFSFIEITIENPGKDAAVGAIVMGLTQDLGVTLSDIRWEEQTRSYNEIDDFKITNLLIDPSDRIEAELKVPAGQGRLFRKALTDLKGRATVWLPAHPEYPEYNTYATAERPSLRGLSADRTRARLILKGI